MTSAECSSELRSAISAAAANRRTTTRAYPASAVHATRLNRRVSTWLRRRSATALCLQAVPDAADRANRRGAPAKAQFLAEIVDVDVDDVRFRIEFVIPHRFGDARARYGATRIAHQELEQRKLARREIYDAIALRDAPRQWIEHDPAHLERGILDAARHGGSAHARAPAARVNRMAS